MDRIKVRKADLLDKLRSNRTAHRDIFEAALDGYKAKVIEILEDRLAKARAGKRVNTYIQLTQPMDQTKDYDRAIGMLEMSTEKEVVLSEKDYQQYVLDDWSWKGQFTSSNKLYAPSSFPDDDEADE